MVNDMKYAEDSFTNEIFEYVENFKELISSQVWQNILLDCSKNELLTLWLLYRYSEVNMTQIAEYIHVPLNTATGIIGRMEKRNLVIRERSNEDKRVVTIQIGEVGRTQLGAIMTELSYYFKRVTEEFSIQEMQLFSRMFQKIMMIMKEERNKEAEKVKVRRITIE